MVNIASLSTGLFTNFQLLGAHAFSKSWNTPTEELSTSQETIKRAVEVTTNISTNDNCCYRAWNITQVNEVMTTFTRTQMILESTRELKIQHYKLEDRSFNNSSHRKTTTSLKGTDLNMLYTVRYTVYTCEQTWQEATTSHEFS